MSEKVVGRYEMLWDCEYCGSTGLLGLTHRHCPECGAVQDPQRRYYPDAEQKVAVSDHRYTGADRVCPSCDAASSAAAVHCGNCGAPLDEAKAAERRREQSAAAGSGFARDSVEQARQERSGGPGKAPPAKTKSYVWVIVLGALALLVTAIVLVLVWRKPETLTVAEASWRRTVAIETMADRRESDWRDRVPRGANGVTCRREKRSTKKVEDGQSCTRKRRDKGDGSFEEVEVCKPAYRSEPVYDDKCTYTVRGWTTSRTLDATGTSVSAVPAWPRVDLLRAGTGLGAEREGARTEVYSVRLESKDGESHECPVDLAHWKLFQPGSRWVGELRMIGGGLACDTLEPAR